MTSLEKEGMQVQQSQHTIPRLKVENVTTGASIVVGRGGVVPVRVEQFESQWRSSSSNSSSTVRSIRYSTVGAPLPPSPEAAAATGRKTSRFQFVGDTRAPSELQALESEALRRRSEFRTRILNIERRAASWSARLANEAIDRDAAHAALVERAVVAPLDAAAERIMARIERELVRPALRPFPPASAAADTAATNKCGRAEEEAAVKYKKAIPELERAANELNEAMLHHTHVAIFDAKCAHLDSLKMKLCERACPALKLESTKADKRERAAVRLYESASGAIGRRFAEENATRVASVKLLEKDVDKAATVEERRTESFLAEIRAIKQMIEEERLERQLGDETVVDRILKTRELLQRTVLESLGDST